MKHDWKHMFGDDALKYTTWAQLNEWQLSGDVKIVLFILWIYSVLLRFSRYKIN